MLRPVTTACRVAAAVAIALVMQAVWGADGLSFGALGLEKWSRQPVLPVPKTKHPPVIDAKLGYHEWIDASIQQAFVDQRAGVQPNLRTALYLKYDDDALYVGVLIERPRFAQKPKADFAKGKHKHIWWKDDNFEIFLIPGERETRAKYSYIFVGNSKGAYAESIKPTARNPVVEWEGQWQYAARWTVRGNKLDHWPCWEAELKIPYSQFVGCQKPAPGVTWEFAFMNQQLTPVRKLITWSQAWSFRSQGYTSSTMGRLRFVGEGVYVQQKRCGRITTAKDKQQLVGNQFMLHSASSTPTNVAIHTALYRSEQKRPDSKATFLSLWDMVRYMDRTGEKMVQDPKMAVQAFRPRADIVAELNGRYKLVRAADSRRTIQAGKPGYYMFKEPMPHGEYLLMTQMRNADTGELLYSYILPCAYFPGFNIKTFSYFLRHKKVRAELELSSFGESVSHDAIQAKLIDSAGRVLDQTRVANLSPYANANVYLDTSKVAEGSTFVIKAELVGPDGKVKHAERVSVRRPPNPEWFGNRIGRSNVICPPFKPLRKTGENAAALYERTYRLGPAGLPDSIVSRGAELLAKPIRFRLETSREIRPEEFALKLESFSDREAKWLSTFASDALAVEVRVTLAYDGMLRYDLSFEPKGQPVTVRELSLNIPMKSEWSRYFAHHATGTRLDSHSTECKGGLLERWFKDYGDAMPFTFAFMLCAEDRGIQWFCPSDRHWSNQRDDKKIAVKSDRASNTLVVSIIDKPKTLSERVDYEFGLTVTPVRPCDPDKPVELISGGLKPLVDRSDKKKVAAAYRMLEAMQEHKVVGVGDYLNQRLFGVPRFYDEKQDKAFRAAIDVAHRHNLKFVPYANWGVNSNLPFFKAFGYEMLREPHSDMSFGCFLQLMASTFPDWYLYTLKHSRETLKIDGNYMDSTQYPRLCANELEGMAWTDDQGRKHGTYDLWGQREFAERLYVFWHHEADEPGIIGSHTSRIPLYFIAPFTDFTLAGEHHIPGKTLEEQCPLDVFQMFYCTWPHGVTTQRLWWNWYKKPLLRNQVWTMNMLHDVLMRTGGGNLLYYGRVVGYGKKAKPYVRIRHVRRAFDDSEFAPYWRQKIVRFSPPGPKASVWINHKRRAALIVVGNIPDREYDGEMTIDARVLPAGERAQVYDAMLDREWGSIDRPIRLRIEPMRYRLVTVGMRIPLPPGARVVSDEPLVR